MDGVDRDEGEMGWRGERGGGMGLREGEVGVEMEGG